MASSGRKRKGSFSLPDWVAEQLECPVCLKTIQDPPIFQCEQGHGLCSTCRKPLKDEGKPCPVCRGKLTEVRMLAVEKMLEKLPQTKCKYNGCTFTRSDAQLVKGHEDGECRQRPVKCGLCEMDIAWSKLSDHLKTNHKLKPFIYHSFGSDMGMILAKRAYWIQNPLQGGFLKGYSIFRTPYEHKELEFLSNWQQYDNLMTLFWISFCGTKKEAKEFEYTLKIESSADKKAGRTKFLLTATRECISCDLSHEDVKRSGNALVLSKDMLAKAAEGNDENELEWVFVIKKK